MHIYLILSHFPEFFHFTLPTTLTLVVHGSNFETIPYAGYAEGGLPWFVTLETKHHIVSIYLNNITPKVGLKLVTPKAFPAQH